MYTYAWLIILCVDQFGICSLKRTVDFWRNWALGWNSGPSSAQLHVESSSCFTQRRCSAWRGDKAWTLHTTKARQSTANPKGLYWDVASNSSCGPQGAVPGNGAGAGA